MVNNLNYFTAIIKLDGKSFELSECRVYVWNCGVLGEHIIEGDPSRGHRA